MKIQIFLFLLTLLLFHFITTAQKLNVKIIDGRNNKPVSTGILILHSKIGKKDVCKKDLNGNFFFQNIDTTKTFEITFSSLGNRDTTFKNISIEGDSTITFIYFFYCQYEASIKNKTCPKCKRKNAVIPIIYGLRIFKNEEEETEDDGKKCIYAGCEITGCDPHWFCKRDKTRF